MKLTEIYPKLFLFKFSSQYLAAFTFMRMQEFYESRFPSIRNSYFTWEHLIDKYVKNGKLTYWADNAGFNVPGHHVIEFYKMFKKELTNKERRLFDTLYSIMADYKDNFYIIGVYKNGDIKHELAHGLYYLNPEYKREIIKLVGKYSETHFSRLCAGLRARGYNSTVFIDEINAYAIDDKKKAFVELFNKYRKT